jgi:methyl-accepting chemotaxis protein
MTALKSIAGLVIGAIAGLVVGFIIAIPACMIASVWTMSTKSGESFANTVWAIVTIGAAVGGFVYPLVLKLREEHQESQQQEEERYRERKKREEERVRQRQEEIARIKIHAAQQEAYRVELLNLCNNALQSFEIMPTHLLNAEKSLEQAETDYQETAFAPFWDSIERVTRRLADFDACVQIICDASGHHSELIKVYEAVPDRFPLDLTSVRGIAAANTISDRLKKVVRTAQRHRDFAIIYEQRRTNQILIAGFANLGEAIDGMGHRIVLSVRNLADRISDMSSTLDTALDTLGSSLISIDESNQQITRNIEELHSTVQNANAERSERHARALAMLNNIQRHQEPTLGDGAY